MTQLSGFCMEIQVWSLQISTNQLDLMVIYKSVIIKWLLTADIPSILFFRTSVEKLRPLMSTRHHTTKIQSAWILTGFQLAFPSVNVFFQTPYNMVHFHSAVPKISTFSKKHKICSLYMLKAVCVRGICHPPLHPLLPPTHGAWGPQLSKCKRGRRDSQKKVKP